MQSVQVLEPVGTSGIQDYVDRIDGATHEELGTSLSGSSPDQPDQWMIQRKLAGNNGHTSDIASLIDEANDPRSSIDIGFIGTNDFSTNSSKLKAHKQLPRWRLRDDEGRSVGKNLSHQESPEITGAQSNENNTTPSSPARSSTTPASLPTPPRLDHEANGYGFDDSSNADTTILRSRLVTPIPQQSPPTPDVTPPRHDSSMRPHHFLGSQASMASTGAESFKTAREDVWSDDEMEDSYPTPQAFAFSSTRNVQNTTPTRAKAFQMRPSPLSRKDKHFVPSSTLESGVDVEVENTINASVEQEHSKSEWPPLSDKRDSPTINHSLSAGAEGLWEASQNTMSPTSRPEEETSEVLQSYPANAIDSPGMPDEDNELVVEEPGIRRGPSLPKPLEDARNLNTSPLTEQFADEIGWSRSVKSADLKNRVNSWRFSGVSTSSTVEAMVVDREPARQPTLRHRGKWTSLRSASSPMPTSNRNSLQSNSDSPRRLVHKKARLSNQDRWSFGSEASRSLSMSSAALPQSRPEIIHVAVIPERNSSLHSSANNSQRHSMATSASSGRRQSHQYSSRGNSLDIPRPHKPTISQSIPSSMSFANRGRDRQFPPTVPPRSSSLSAPTSVSNSRANSITSEHLRLRRVAAEEDVRKTLARMESNMSPIATVNAEHLLLPIAPLPERDDTQSTDVRPVSTLTTPFSQPSFYSATPPLEMGEARAVNFFPHHNHSLQLVETNTLPESRAVQELHANGPDLHVLTHQPMTPISSLLPMLSVDSPLRNPRDPPKPPDLTYIAASLDPRPANVVNGNHKQYGLGRSVSARRFGSQKRPALGVRHNSESFMRSLGRSFSLKAKNKKVNQDLDGSLHPFWRPRGFWDDFSDADDDESFGSDQPQEQDRDLIVANSFGMPMKRTVFMSPLSLVRSISDGAWRRRRQNPAGITKRASYGSLSRLRAGRAVILPGLGLRWKRVRERVSSVRHRKEDERREKRREDLRRAIGPNVVPRGDSRFPIGFEDVVEGPIRAGGMAPWIPEMRREVEMLHE